MHHELSDDRLKLPHKRRLLRRNFGSQISMCFRQPQLENYKIRSRVKINLPQKPTAY